MVDETFQATNEDLSNATRSRHLFISYSSLDAQVADEIVRQLELAHVTCWIAPRDIHVGADYASEIIPAIRDASGVLFVYSENSNQSKQCLREIETAIDCGVDIFPIRLDPTPMEPGLQYRLSTVQFVDWSSTDALRLVTTAVMSRNAGTEAIAEPLVFASVQTHPRSFEAVADLVGREHEAATLTKILDTVAESGRGQFVLIGGESGVGKSALISFLAANASASGYRVCETTCGSFLDGVAFFPIREILRQLTDSTNDTVAYAKKLYGPTSQQAAMAAVVDSNLADAGSRREATVATFANLTIGTANQNSGQPLLILIDDMENADSGSVDGLLCLLARIEEGPVLVVGAYRTDVIDVAVKTQPVESLISAIRRDTDTASTLELNPLTKSSYQDVMAVMLGGPVHLPPDALNYLWNETEGNVLFLREVVQALSRESNKSAQPALVEVDGVWHLRGSLDDLSTPRSVEETIARNLEGVTDSDRAYLEAAAVIGKQFKFELAVGISGTDDDELLSALERFMAQAILHELTESVDSFEFKHNKVRDVLYNSLSQMRRRRIHSKIADILLASPAGYSDSLIGEHLYRANRYSEAVQYLNRSADALLDVREFDRAVDQLTRVQEILEQGTVVNGFDPTEVNLRLLRALYDANDFAECNVLALRMVSMSGIDDEGRGWAFDTLGDLAWVGRRIPEAVSAYEQAEKLSGGHPRLELEVCADLHELHDRERERTAGFDDEVSSRHDESAAHYLEREVTLAETVGTPWDRARAYRNQAKSLRRAGDIPAAIAMYERSLAQTDSRVAPHQVLISYAKTLRLANRADAARAVVKRVYDWSMQTGARRSKATALYCRAMIQMDGGEATTSAKKDLDEALAIQIELGFSRGKWEVLLIRGEWFAIRGEWKEAFQDFRTAIGASESGDATVIEIVLAQLKATDAHDRADRLQKLWNNRAP